jgi:antitoxin component of MazEF toxin-antitoxin module
MTEQNKQFTITKRIAKHGKQAVIVIPTVLAKHLEPQMLVSVTIEVLDDSVEGGK